MSTPWHTKPIEPALDSPPLKMGGSRPQQGSKEGEDL